MSREYTVSLRGSGRVQLPAYGVADAEHQAEKELTALWPGCRVDVLEIARGQGSGRIVEEFAVRFALRGQLRVEAEDAARAGPAAMRSLRERLVGTRYERITLEPVG